MVCFVSRENVCKKEVLFLGGGLVWVFLCGWSSWGSLWVFGGWGFGFLWFFFWGFFLSWFVLWFWVWFVLVSFYLGSWFLVFWFSVVLIALQAAFWGDSPKPPFFFYCHYFQGVDFSSLSRRVFDSLAGSLWGFTPLLIFLMKCIFTRG